MNSRNTSQMRKITFLLFFSLVSLAATSQSFKSKFNKVFQYIVKENYNEALPLLFELEQDEPKNMNIKSMIGYCYLKTTYDKYKAIPYYEKVVAEDKNLNPFYSNGDHREKKAPVESIRFLGQAYHFNYQFEEAMQQYNEYKDLIDPSNRETLNEIKRDIQITENAMALKEKPTQIQLKSLGTIINTKFPEYRPIVNADETVMIFTSRREEGVGDELDENGLFYEDIYISYKNEEDDDWGEPKLLSQNVNTEQHEACLHLDPDAQHMFVYKSDDQDGGIYESFLDGEEWSVPVELKNGINTKYYETHANQSANGRTIAFVSDRPGGKGGRDIWMIKQLPDGNWGLPQNFGPEVNTEYDEDSPYLHPDGKSLYFSSKGHNTMGGFDVFVSEMQPDGFWGEPRNIGFPINTTGDDVFFVPTTDGKRAYFSSYRDGGMGDQDIYIIELVSEIEKNLTVYKGYSKDAEGNVVPDVVITVFDSKTGEIAGEYRPNKKTGKFLFILQEGYVYSVEYEVNGMVTMETVDVEDTEKFLKLGRLVVAEKDKISIEKTELSDGDVVKLVNMEDADNIDLVEVSILIPPAEQKKLGNKISKILNRGDKLVLKNLQFYFDRTRILERSKPELQLVLNFLKDNPDVRVRIEGHTDSKGSNSYNLDLSKRRAAKIKQILASKGIDKSRMETAGFGETSPLLPNKNPDGSDNPVNREKNRRVEFSIIK